MMAEISRGFHRSRKDGEEGRGDKGRTVLIPGEKKVTVTLRVLEATAPLDFLLILKFRNVNYLVPNLRSHCLVFLVKSTLTVHNE